MPERSLEHMRQVTQAMEIFSDPAAVARDPDAAIRAIEARTGQPVSAEDAAELRQWAASQASSVSAAGGAAAGGAAGSGVARVIPPGAAAGIPPGASAPEYIPARDALRLGAPLLFGTFLQSYATRHGWLAGLPLMRRLRWRLTAANEIVAGGAHAVLGMALAKGTTADAVTGAGIGVAAGGVLTWLVAPAMAARTREGAVMKAQLAAYRRTLQLTFAQARSMDQAVTASGLPWLETPDQALVWGIALGLRADIEALLARTAGDLRQEGSPPAAYAPAWYSAGTPTAQGAPTAAGAPVMPASLVDPAAMFAGIEAIGSQAGQPA
jgi:hypothetical protein